MDNERATSIVHRASRAIRRAKQLLNMQLDEARHSVQVKAWAATPRSELEQTARSLERDSEAKQASLQKMRDKLSLQQVKTTLDIIAAREEDARRVQYYELAADFVPAEKREAAQEIVYMATDHLGTKTPRIRWFSRETAADRAYKAEHGADDFEGFRRRPVAGWAEGAKGWAGKDCDIWIDASLSVADIAGVAAREVSHLDPAIGFDEVKADAFAAPYLAANPQLGESKLFAKDVDQYLSADPNLPTRYAQQRPANLGYDDGQVSPLAQFNG